MQKEKKIVKGAKRTSIISRRHATDNEINYPIQRGIINDKKGNVRNKSNYSEGRERDINMLTSMRGRRFWLFSHFQCIVRDYDDRQFCL